MEVRALNTSIVRWVAWIAAAVFFVVLALHDLGPGRTITINAQLDHATPRLSTFGPEVRVVRSAGAVRVVGEPVYVRMRLPRWFRSARVEFTYQNPDGLAVQYGFRTHPTDWTFQLLRLPDPTGMEPPQGMADGQRVDTASVPVTLDRAWQVERNVYEFMLSAHGASAEHPFVIRSFRVVAERAPICVRQLCV